MALRRFPPAAGAGIQASVLCFWGLSRSCADSFRLGEPFLDGHRSRDGAAPSPWQPCSLAPFLFRPRSFSPLLCSSRRLVTLARGLAPAFLRFAGKRTDFLQFQNVKNPAKSRGGPGPDYYLKNYEDGENQASGAGRSWGGRFSDSLGEEQAKGAWVTGGQGQTS